MDIRRFGSVFYRVTFNATLLQRARDQLHELFPSSGSFTPATLFIATWDRVAESGGGSQVCICTYDVTVATHCNTIHRASIMGYTTVVVRERYLCRVSYRILSWGGGERDGSRMIVVCVSMRAY